MAGWEADLYFKKRIVYAINRQHFVFDAAELLFSTHSVDSGTQFLLRYLLPAVRQPARILDLGCGYGVIGIVLARFHPQAHVTMSDKDLLAVRYSQHNAELNNVPNTTTLASIGTDDLPPGTFDLIVSNVPGHIGDAAIVRDFVLKPIERLSEGGAYWIVVVTPLVELIERTAQEHNLTYQPIAQHPQHRVYRFDKLGDQPPDQ
jgi:16S rRNA (guanine1207-N2)-methyltransferase